MVCNIPCYSICSQLIQFQNGLIHACIALDNSYANYIAICEKTLYFFCVCSDVIQTTQCHACSPFHCPTRIKSVTCLYVYLVLGIKMKYPSYARKTYNEIYFKMRSACQLHYCAVSQCFKNLIDPFFIAQIMQPFVPSAMEDLANELIGDEKPATDCSKPLNALLLFDLTLHVRSRHYGHCLINELMIRCLLHLE